MSKQPTSPSQHIEVEADHELQRLRGLPGFQAFEQQLEIGLEKLTQRWSAWQVRGESALSTNRNLRLAR